jgi:four helix bundle protein
MTPKDLKARTEEFSRCIVRFCTPLFEDRRATDIARQLLRSGTAVDSNYGSAQRGRSHKEFTSRLGTVYDDASESYGWLDLLKTSVAPASDLLTFLHRESDELTRIFAAILPHRASQGGTGPGRQEKAAVQETTPARRKPNPSER